MPTETRTIRLTRVGDFYEAYGAEAETMARELEITLTGRMDKATGERVAMAGVPYHALDRYVERLAAKGIAVEIGGGDVH